MDQLMPSMSPYTSAFALTGDTEIDDVCPSHPRILSEILIVQIDSGRLMLIGGLSAPIIGCRIGALDVMTFLQQLDGTRPLWQLCAKHLPTLGERKRILYILLRNGLLEQPATGKIAINVPQQTYSFLAKVMDQTRVHNCRQDVIAAFQRPIGILGANQFCTDLQQALRESGLNVNTHEPNNYGQLQWMIVILDADTSQDELVHQLQRENIPLLLICPRDDALDFGPMLINKGTCTTACYRVSCVGQSYALNPAYQQLWLASLCNAIILLNSGTLPLSLVNNYMRYQITVKGIQTSNHSVPRRFVLEPQLSTIHTLNDRAQLQRLERHSKVAVPPPRIIGVKNHDVHYALENIAAAKHFPLPHTYVGNTISKANATPQQRILLELIARGFGYWEEADGNVKRICPSGGNLGAPECLVIWRDKTRQSVNLLRYVPVADRLEPIARATMLPLQTIAVPEYEIICLTNIEKVRHKYFDFGLSLAFLDGGFSAAFLHAAAQTIHQTLAFEHSRVPEQWVEDALQHRNHYYAFVWRTTLPSLNQQSVPQWDKFDQLLRHRRAARDCNLLNMDMPQIAALLEMTRPVSNDARIGDLLSYLRPVLIVEQAGRCETYEFVTGCGLRRLIDSTITCDQPGKELLSQRNLSRAAARLFMLTDLPRVLQVYGAAGHDQLLTLTGQWIGGLWLDIERHQHHGCPAGATVESDLLSNLPQVFRNLFNLFAFTFGQSRDPVQ